MRDHAESGPATAQPPVALDRDLYARDVLGELAGALERIVGREDAAGMVAAAARAVARRIDADLRARSGGRPPEPEGLPEVLAEVMTRAGGDFHVVEADERRIVLANRACPFGEAAAGRPALCMTTSQVLGTIAAGAAGYAKVEIEEAIARGHAGCRLVVHLRLSHEARLAQGREYFGGDG
jgi:predicted ArsR family transcriptional regulator